MIAGVKPTGPVRERDLNGGMAMYDACHSQFEEPINPPES
jgi:hypothetical protein